MENGKQYDALSDIYGWLIEEARKKNTPTESSATYQGEQDKAGEEATQSESAQLVNSTTPSRTQQKAGAK